MLFGFKKLNKAVSIISKYLGYPNSGNMIIIANKAQQKTTRCDAFRGENRRKHHVLCR